MPSKPHRPSVRSAPYAFRDAARNETPGIALWGRRGLAAHLTYSEAVKLADHLHDLVDAAGNTEPPLPTTPAEQE